jgi:hypothetical protein
LVYIGDGRALSATDINMRTSAPGTQQTWLDVRIESAFRGKADHPVERVELWK